MPAPVQPLHLRSMEEYTVGAAGMRVLIESLASVGLPVTELLKDVGFEASCLDNPDARVPEVQLLGLWLAAQQRWRGELLGLQAGSNLAFGAFEVLDYVIAARPSFGAAFRKMAEYFAIVSTGMGFTVDETGTGDVVMCMVHPYALELLPPSFVEYIWTVIVTRFRRETDARLRPKLFLRHLPLGDRAAYTRVLGSVAFGAERYALHIPREQWNIDNPRRDPALSNVLERYARELIARLPKSQTAIDRVRSAITESLRGGGGIECTASRLGLSVRSLQRLLAHEGYTYKSAVDEIRAGLALAYLTSGVPSLAEVAYLLGYSEPSAFHRAFRRWTGVTPLEYRAREPRSPKVLETSERRVAPARSGNSPVLAPQRIRRRHSAAR